MRWIAVVMGAHTSAACFDEAKRLLALGFNSSHKGVIVRQDAPMGPEMQVSGRTVRKIRTVAETDLAVVVKKGAEKQLVTDVQVPPRLDAPAHRGQVIGDVRVTQQDQTLASTAAVILEDIPHVGLMWRLFGR
jgi:serine-type D-Ala-D-Ala carboxypeptidase (penicillin-binding protein 5/6)